MTIRTSVKAREKNNRAQITLFIILGIVILFTSVSIYVMISKQNDSRIQNQYERVQELALKKDKYENFVKYCVEETAKEGILLLGKQGGAIYDYQADGGKRYLGPPAAEYGRFVLPIKDSYDNIIYNVSYGITNTRYDLSHPPVPLYPYGITKLVPIPEMLHASYVNTLGNYPEPGPFIPLCDYNGLNNPKKASMQFACAKYDSANPSIRASAQEYLESYISDRMPKCANFSNMPELSKSEIVFGNISTKTMISDESISVKVDFPVTIMTEDGDTIRLDSYRINIKSRLKQIYELALNLIENDVNNIFFDIVNDAPTLNNCKSRTGGNALCLKEGLEVVKISNPCKEIGYCRSDGNYDDILEIRDTKVKFGSRPYVFRFAIENRPPAIDLMRQSMGIVGYGYDFLTFVGSEIKIEPKGYDPDEDYHNIFGYMDNIYEYALWKETYDDYYNYMLCSFDPHACENDPELTTIIDTHVSPLAWSSSGLYLDTNRSANYTTNATDRGFHYLKVQVCDAERLCDYQILRIYVGGFIFNSSTNFFPTIPNHLVSLEDPYKIIFPNVTGITPDIRSFTFYNSSGERYKEVNRTASEGGFVDIPESITTIPINPYTAEFFPAVGDYSIRLSAYDGYNTLIWDSESIGCDLELQAYECLPYRSTTPPYPFNDDSEVFFGNHSCCIGEPGDDPITTPGWGTYQPTTQECYRYTEYGCRDDPDFVLPLGIAAITSTTYDDGAFPTPDDIYLRTLKVYCSGISGNTCTGDVLETQENTHISCLGSCRTCGYNKDTPICAPVPGNPICDHEVHCTHGPGLAYDPADPSGKFACKGACRDGKCNSSADCICSKDCSARCEDDSSFDWEGNTCRFNCSYYVGVNDPMNCELKDSESTFCASPDPNGDVYFTSVMYGGTLTDIIAANESSGGFIIDEDMLIAAGYPNHVVATFCIDSTTPTMRCHVSSCSDEGAFEYDGEICSDPGTVTPVPGGTPLCYFNNATRCNIMGECTAKESAPFSDPGLYRTVPFINTNGDCIYPESNSGFCADDDDDGWDILTALDSTRPACSNPVTCTMTGWDCPP